ncbi:MAG: hypothetical protein ACOY7T_00345 [Pseudomonadota bacterium]
MVGPGLYVGDVAEYRGDAVLERVGGLQFLIGPVQPFGYRLEFRTPRGVGKSTVPEPAGRMR